MANDRMTPYFELKREDAVKLVEQIDRQIAKVAMRNQLEFKFWEIQEEHEDA